MGRITAYDQNGRMVADFDKSEYDLKHGWVGTLTAEQVREAWCGHLRRDCLYDPPTPDWQAIADELNAALGVNGATGERRDDARPCREVYLVEVSDDLLESWYTIAVYQCREAAESRAEALRREVDGVRHFARVSKLEVVDAC